MDFKVVDNKPALWCDELSIADDIHELACDLHDIEQRAKHFPDAPPGLSGLPELLLQISEAWHEYGHPLCIERSAELDEDD